MLSFLLVVVQFPAAVEQAKHGRGIHLHDQGPRPETDLANMDVEAFSVGPRACKFSRVAASQLMAGRSSVGFLVNGIEGSDGQKKAPRPVAEIMTMMCLNFIP